MEIEKRREEIAKAEQMKRTDTTEPKETSLSNEVDEWTQLLTRYKLIKFVDSLEEDGYADIEDCVAIADEELIKYGFRKGNLMAWNRMMRRNNLQRVTAGSYPDLIKTSSKSPTAKPNPKVFQTPRRKSGPSLTLSESSKIRKRGMRKK